MSRDSWRERAEKKPALAQLSVRVEFGSLLSVTEKWEAARPFHHAGEDPESYAESSNWVSRLDRDFRLQSPENAILLLQIVATAFSRLVSYKDKDS